MAHAHKGRMGNSAASGRAEEDMAVAPYTNPQIRMYGPKYQDVHRPRERQPSKMVRPLASEYRPAPSTSTIFMIVPAMTAHNRV